MTTTPTAVKPLAAALAAKLAKAKTAEQVLTAVASSPAKTPHTELLARAVLIEKDKAHLGNATTASLIDELTARASLGGYASERTRSRRVTTAELLDELNTRATDGGYAGYRTVDGD